MEWEDFKHFLAVARTGSLSKAAIALRSSPATVGRRIASMEASLTARLFERRQSGYSLTELGEAIRCRAEDIEESVLALQREAFGRDLQVTGKVRLATAEDIASLVVAPHLAAFKTLHPGITIEVVANWDVANLSRREADVALRTARPTQGDYVIRKIGTWKCALYVAKRYAEERRLTIPITALDGIELIAWTEESAFHGGAWFEQQGKALPIVFAANSRHIQHAACRAGLGAAVLPCLAGDPDAELVQILLSNHVRNAELWLVTHQDLHRTARVRALRDFLTEIAPP